MLIAALAPLLFGPATMPPVDAAARRWGRVGHRAIAMAVAPRLSPAARQAVRALLGDETLADASTWADSIRSERPEASSWHYIDIPVTTSRLDRRALCAHGCILDALDRQLAILRDRRQPRQARVEALRWVVHLVEDLHMPLHAGERGDRGGNDVAITFRGRRTNLHSLWDYGMLEDLGYDDATLATAISNGLTARDDVDELAEGGVVDWALESHDISRDVVYPSLPQSLELDQRYELEVLPALELQLARATVRLTRILDDALRRG